MRKVDHVIHRRQRESKMQTAQQYHWFWSIVFIGFAISQSAFGFSSIASRRGSFPLLSFLLVFVFSSMQFISTGNYKSVIKRCLYFTLLLIWANGLGYLAGLFVSDNLPDETIIMRFTTLPAITAILAAVIGCLSFGASSMDISFHKHNKSNIALENDSFFRKCWIFASVLSTALGLFTYNFYYGLYKRGLPISSYIPNENPITNFYLTAKRLRDIESFKNQGIYFIYVCTAFIVLFLIIVSIAARIRLNKGDQSHKIEQLQSSHLKVSQWVRCGICNERVPRSEIAVHRETHSGDLSTSSPRESTRRCNFCSERVEHSEFVSHVKAHAGNRSASEVGIVPDDMPSNEPTSRCHLCGRQVIDKQFGLHLALHKVEGAHA
jgi:hypothetical protein